jgi:AraC family transcriptional activator of pobA
VKKIPEVAFSRKKSPEFEFELLTIKQLLSRIADSEINIDTVHRISFFQVSLITAGSGTWFIDFEGQPYEEGSLVISLRDQVQAFDFDKNIEGLILLFTREFISRSASHLDAALLGGLAGGNLERQVITPGEVRRSGIPTLFDQLKCEYSSNTDMYKEDILRTLITALIFKILRLQRSLSPVARNAEWATLFLRLKEMLQQKIAETRNAEDYAGMLGTSYRHLNQVCNGMTGMTAKKFIDNWLLLEIKKEIATSNISVKELAWKYGFSEPTNFVKYFQKREGVTPRRFRDSLQK